MNEKPELKFEASHNVATDTSYLTASYQYLEVMRHGGQEILRTAIELAAKELSEQFLKEHGQDILKAIDPVAVSNMAIAEAGAAVNETLKKKLPDKIEHIVEKETQVYQRGFFGGLKRV